MQSEQSKWQEEREQLRQRVADLEQVAEHHRRSAEDLQRFFTLSLDMLCIVDFAGFFKRLNPSWEQVLGFSIEELLARPFIERIHPDDLERTMAVAEEAMSGQEVIRFENRYCRKDGTYRWLEWQAISLVEEQLFYAVARDITQRKQAEEEVQRLNAEALRIFKSLVENAMDGITMSDMDGLFSYANASYCRMLGYTFEELQGYSVATVFDDPSQTEQVGQELTTGGTWSGSITYRRKDRSTFEGHVQSWLLYDEAEQPQAVAGVVRDVTEQQQHERSLRQSQALLQSLLDNMPLAVYVKDAEGRYTIINQLAATFLHASSQEVVGKTDHDLLPPEVARMWLQNHQHVLTSGETLKNEFEFPLEDGRHTFVSMLFPLLNIQGEIYAVGGISTDMTERKRAEEERAILQQQIIDAQQAAIRELSTPLLPLAEHVIALPLVGSIDSSRAQQVMETLLEGIAAYQADVAIVDITGVKVVDTQIAQMLLQTARAVRLLGAQIILTGISSALAQTLVHLGADLSGIITRSTLQQGIAWALHDSLSNEEGRRFLPDSREQRA